MNKNLLLQKCKELGIKGVSSKTKNEILVIIEKQEKQIINYENKLTDVFKELLTKTQKDKPRKVCKNCNELGHNITSKNCKINLDKNNKIKDKIKKYILSQNCLEDKTIDDYCIDLSSILDITPNFCKTLYNEIPVSVLLDRTMNIELYLQNNFHLTKKCNDCNKKILYIQSNSYRIWKDNYLCDTCWYKYENCRMITWENIKKYKPIHCEICSSIQTTTERYHYDHLNMFDKDKSIFTMVNEGINIEEIYYEIDKCQILCISCHHIVTDIERKLGFTQIKQYLTRNINNNEITKEEYNIETIYYQKIYQEKMKNIYTILKQNLKKLLK
jgi:hypothetical protein